MKYIGYIAIIGWIGFGIIWSLQNIPQSVYVEEEIKECKWTKNNKNPYNSTSTLEKFDSDQGFYFCKI